MLLDQIPGLKRAKARAVQREEAIRRAAFMPCAERICGVDVYPFTPRHFLLLDEARSPFIGHAGTPFAEHVVQFLWIVSTAFLMPTRQLPLREIRPVLRDFTARLRRVPYLRARRQIDAYVEAAFFDAPGGGGGEDSPIASTAAFLIHRYGKAYGWAPETLDARGQPVHGGGTLDRPFAQLFQLNRLITLDENPDYYPANKLSDGIERTYVKRHTRRQKARLAKRKEGR